MVLKKKLEKRNGKHSNYACYRLLSLVMSFFCKWIEVYSLAHFA